MTQAVPNKLVSFIWSIADDCLCDVYVDGKYRDVILPMVVLRPLDALLEPSKDAVMEMANKMMPLTQSSMGTRIASVHYGSSLFTGNASGDESNIRRYLIENDWLEAIFQMPNNLYYHTGITTYILILSNNKAANRKGKVQLIDAGLLFQKHRKNLGAKNCESSPAHIRVIVSVYEKLQEVERPINSDSSEEEGLASNVFNNADCGYYKVTIERPKPLKAEFSAERIAELRYDKSLKEIMAWAYGEFGDEVYTNLKGHSKVIVEHAEKQVLNLKAKQIQALTRDTIWEKQMGLLKTANQLKKEIGTDEFSNFNLFKEKVDLVLKSLKIKLSVSEKNTILNAASWNDSNAVKVIKGKVKLSDKLSNLLSYLGCISDQLPDYGYFSSEKKGEFMTYETKSDLRDTENVPLSAEINDYFLQEVKPHLDEAWINLDATKIGDEISFNKYFYRHKPLRSLEEVTKDILQLESENDGLIREILQN